MPQQLIQEKVYFESFQDNLLLQLVLIMDCIWMVLL